MKATQIVYDQDQKVQKNNKPADEDSEKSRSCVRFPTAAFKY